VSKRGDTAQNGGSPDGPEQKRNPKGRTAQGKASKASRGPADRVKEGRRNEEIFMERVAGRSARALAAQFGLSTRQIYDIVKSFREAEIANLELGGEWRSHQFAEEHLLELDEMANSLRELELAAGRQNNLSSALGALKQRIQLTRDRTRFLQETGLMSGPRNLRLQAEVNHVWTLMNEAFDEHDISDAVRAENNTKLAATPGAERGQPPAHWMRTTLELEAAMTREREAMRRDKVEAELLRQGEERRDAEEEEERRKQREERMRHDAEENAKSAARQEQFRRDLADGQVPREEMAKMAAARSLSYSHLSDDELARLLGADAPLEHYGQ
jgi:transposase